MANWQSHDQMVTQNSPSFTETGVSRRLGKFTRKILGYRFSMYIIYTHVYKYIYIGPLIYGVPQSLKVIGWKSKVRWKPHNHHSGFLTYSLMEMVPQVI